MKRNLSTKNLGLALILGWFSVATIWTARAVELEDSGATNEVIYTREMVRIGASVEIKKNEISREVVVVLGSAKVDGRIQGDLVVVGGSATIEGAVEGDMVVVLGSAKLGPAAVVNGDAVVIGGPLNAAPTAKIKGSRFEIPFGLRWLGLGWLKEWFTKGLFWMRPLPPQVGWVWGLTGIMLLVYIFLSLLFPRQVQACVQVLESRPFATILAGILAFFLVGPLLLLLTVTGIGLLVVPFLLCAMMGAFLFGKLAIYQFTGQQIGRQFGAGLLQQPLVALVVGMALFCLLYMIPVLGFVVWGVIAPWGVGAVCLALAGGFRREKVRANGAGIPPASPAAPLSPPPVLSAELTPPAPTDLSLMPRAGFWIRLCATLIDLVLIGVALGILGSEHFILPVWMVYHVGMWAWKGTTIGGIVLGLKLIRRNGQPLGFAVALVRCLACFLSAVAVFIGYFWAGWDRESQAWHDKIADTLIVKMPKGVSLI